MEDRTVSLGRYIWASSHVHAILVARGKSNTPLFRLRCLRKGRRFTSISTGKIFLATRPDLLLRSRFTVRRAWLERERPSMIFAFHAFALVDRGWGDDLYYGAIQLFAALTVCDFLSESATLRFLTLTTQGSAFWTVLHLTRFPRLNA